MALCKWNGCSLPACHPGICAVGTQCGKRARSETWRIKMPVPNDHHWFLKHVDTYDADVDEIMGSVFDSFHEITLPDLVVRPAPFKHLCVSVPADDIIRTEWSSELAVEVYANLPKGDRHERHEYLKAIDLDAFKKESPSCHLPPNIHV
jgi:hypothetical protein